jgi:hypothetical protein
LKFLFPFTWFLRWYPPDTDTATTPLFWFGGVSVRWIPSAMLPVNQEILEESELKKKKGKFSAKETSIILEEVESYLNKNKLSLEDLCPELRDKRTRSCHPLLWNRLEELIPMRSKNVSTS